MNTDRTFIAIDLKSFYASVECVERHLDPLKTNLVVADVSRTEKTICLAVSPPLKAYGIPGRARLFEVVQRVKEINIARKQNAPGHQFTGESFDAGELASSPALSLSYIAAAPRMAHYMACSTAIYNIYLKYIAPEDILVYSIDEVFMDVTQYLKTYRMTARELTMKMIHDILQATGITATAGIGTNLYLCKIAMDIVAKHMMPDADGVRMAELDERSYRQLLWAHTPITDFWRVGRGYAARLAEHGMYTMGDVARCSLGGPGDYYNEELLYKIFGINAELLIDHAWGWESCLIEDTKSYKPDTHSISSGQVLQCPYDFEKGRLIVREMTDLLTLDLVDKGLVTDRMTLTAGYDVESLKDPAIRKKYKGGTTFDPYGREIPKHAQGTVNLERQTSSTRMITEAVVKLYDRIVNPDLLIRRVYVVAEQVEEEKNMPVKESFEQMDLFTDYEALEEKKKEEDAVLAREKKMQQAAISIKKKFGKNAILKGMNLQEGAMTIKRNHQVGGHQE